jgi:site-specific DNA recombinase
LYKDEEALFVKGQYEPLISDTLFYKVQEVLDGRRRQYKLKSVADMVLPLRGHLICPECGKPLKRVLCEAWHDQAKGLLDDKKELLSAITEIEDKMNYLRDMLASQKLDPEDFRKMKSEYGAKLERLEVKMAAGNVSPMNIDQLVDQGVENLFRVSQVYEAGSPEQKKSVVGSMFPENLTFDGFLVRTTRLNEGARLIYTLNAGLSENKNGQSEEISALSNSVIRMGHFSNHFLNNLRLIIDLSD